MSLLKTKTRENKAKKKESKRKINEIKKTVRIAITQSRTEEWLPIYRNVYI